MIANVVKEAYQDPTTKKHAWLCVDIAPVKPLKHPVSLAKIKATPALAEMALIRRGRLSVQPVTAPEYAKVLAFAEKG
jgi:predicted RNA-binding protein with PUA-like domain